MGYIHTELFPGITIGDFSPVHIMAVINLSPESFYKQSYIAHEKISEKALRFIRQGATILDLGARSTAPWSDPITLKEEKNRIKNALNELKPILTEIPKSIMISIDTQYAEVAEVAIDFAQDHPEKVKLIINDVSSFKTDPKLLDLVVENQVPTIIMATERKPGDTKSIRDILNALEQTYLQLEKKGYDMSHLIIDPGVGKWVKEKTYEYDLSILDNLEDFRAFACPILVGLSRKSFIGTTLDKKDPVNRDVGSIASTSIAVYNGAHIIRTHDITNEMQQTIKMASAIRKKPILAKKDEESQVCEYLKPFYYTRSAYQFLKNPYKVTPAGSRIMKNKMVLRYIILRNLTAPQALILKQEMLARGGECGIDKTVITTEWEKYQETHDVVLIGTIKQLESLIQKLKGQSLKLDLIASLVENTLHKAENPKVLYSKDFSIVKPPFRLTKGKMVKKKKQKE